MTWDDLQQHDVNVYSTPWCGDCRRFKSILKERGIAFNEVDIDADPQAAEHLAKATGHKAIPYAEIDGRFMVKGWHKDKPSRWDDQTFLQDVESGLSGN